MVGVKWLKKMDIQQNRNKIQFNSIQMNIYFLPFNLTTYLTSVQTIQFIRRNINIIRELVLQGRRREAR